jgi:hypothetical protein
MTVQGLFELCASDCWHVARDVLLLSRFCALAFQMPSLPLGMRFAYEEEMFFVHRNFKLKRRIVRGRKSTRHDAWDHYAGLLHVTSGRRKGTTDSNSHIYQQFYFDKTVSRGVHQLRSK